MFESESGFDEGVDSERSPTVLSCAAMALEVAQTCLSQVEIFVQHSLNRQKNSKQEVTARGSQWSKRVHTAWVKVCVGY